MSVVLALDLARQAGWAIGSACSPPLYGTWRLDAPREAGRFLQLGRLVSNAIQEHGITQCILEEPYVGKLSRTSSLMPLFGYRAAAMMAAEAASVLMFTASPSTIRKHFIGTGAGKRDAVKSAVMERCRWRGWHPRNTDEADSLAILDYRLAVLSPEHLVHGMRKPALTEASQV